MRMKTVILTLSLLFGMVNIFTPTQSYAISLDDDEEDMEDAEAYLRKAQQKADGESFSEAQKYLKKAKRLGVMRDEVKTTESRIQQAKNAYEERLEREAKARAEKERKEKEEKARLARLKREREERARQARLASQREQSYTQTDYGLPKNMCSMAVDNYALYNYCMTGHCEGFIENFALHQLCEYDDPNGFGGSSGRNGSIYFYLKNGGYLNNDYFSNKVVFQSGNFNGTFRERKNFILYLLSGTTLVRY